MFAALLAQHLFLLRAELQNLRQQLKAEHVIAEYKITALKNETSLEPLTFVFLSSPQAGATGGGPSAIVARHQSKEAGAFVSDQLPPPGPDEEYRLWIENDEHSSSAGILAIDSPQMTLAQFKVLPPVAYPMRILITRERKGSVGKTPGPLVLSGKI